MKKTLLALVQDVLNNIDADEVNSIDDTVESQQVANIIRQVYEGMLSHRNWPHTRKILTLDSSTNSALPTYFRTPENLKEMEVFKYDKHKIGQPSRYEEVRYLYPDHFLRFVSARSQSNVNVQTITDPSGVKLFILNNVAPSYWTSFDDDYIICDSFDAAVDDTLQSSKTQVIAYIEPKWSHTDWAVPDLPTEAFSALLEESKSVASLVVKQAADQKAEANSVKQQRWLSRKAWRAHGGVRYDNYGRIGRK